MKFIKQSFESINEPTYTRQIEKCGRVCYKSESKIAPGTDTAFVQMLIKREHTAMLEHGTIYLFITEDRPEFNELVMRYQSNKYSAVVIQPYQSYTHESGIRLIKAAYITTNFRVMLEHKYATDLLFACEPTCYHYKRVTIKFICSRQVSHQFVRHRVFSFAQESTQYCNYSLGRFGSEITFIEPSWYSNSSFMVKALFKGYLHITEWLYMFLLKALKKPHLAAAILPNITKTELCMTGFTDDWLEFINLRAKDDNISQTYELIQDMNKNLNYLFI